jgi:hypothetical protein
MEADDTRSCPALNPTSVRWLLGLILLVLFLIRAGCADQPIVENYVGRQVPTAMVARNLERGSGLLRPQLDTAPFPSYFLVEPPLYELGAVVLRTITGSSLTAAGRTLSALAMVLAAWGLFELARRRQGERLALWAVSAFAVFPLTIRYGRAFQPDAMMLGMVLSGLACWDRFFASGLRSWMLAGWCLLAVGFAVKVTSAVLLVPLLIVIVAAPRARYGPVVCSTVLPAICWYAWANWLVDSGAGSRASADNRALWLGIAGPAPLLERETLDWVVRFLFARAFTPVGAALALWGLFQRRHARFELWWIWGISGLVLMALLSRKLHHEYYWLILAPVVAVGVGAALEPLAARRRVFAVVLVAALLSSTWLFVRSTWQTPREWSHLESAARTVARIVPPGAWVAASEALLFQADRRGCRMEWTSAAAERAAGEWGETHNVHRPLDLVAFYRTQGARYFADLGGEQVDHARKLLHDGIRRRYKVIVDRPEIIVADLVDSETPRHAN